MDSNNNDEARKWLSVAIDEARVRNGKLRTLSHKEAMSLRVDEDILWSWRSLLDMTNLDGVTRKKLIKLAIAGRLRGLW